MIVRDIKEVIHLYKKQKARVVISGQQRLRNKEYKKFKNERRKAIYSQIVLTPEQESQIDELYLNHYGEKIPDIWHRYYTAFTGNFDKYFFPELLYIPEFEYYMNPHSAYNIVFEDKNVLPLIAKAMNIKMPKTVLSVVKGIYHDKDNRIISKSEAKDILKMRGGALFAKPAIDSCSGQGCRIINILDDKDVKTGETIDEIFEKLGNDSVFQEVVKCHSDITGIYDKSVNTFRVITYIWNDEICTVPSVMRIGKGGANVDNAHAGGIFIAIDDDGSLHEKAFTEFKDVYTEHPDTNVKFKDCKIYDFPKVLEAAKKMHSAISQIGVVNWDFTIDETGEPLLIEANIMGGSIWLSQMAHGKGPFGEKTPEILEWLREKNSEDIY